WSIKAGNNALREGGSQIALGHRERGIKFGRLLEVSDGFLVSGAFVGVDTLVQLIASGKAVAPAHGEHHAAQGHRESNHSCGLIHVLLSFSFRSCLYLARL